MRTASHIILFSGVRRAVRRLSAMQFMHGYRVAHMIVTGGDQEGKRRGAPSAAGLFRLGEQGKPGLLVDDPDAQFLRLLQLGPGARAGNDEIGS